MNVTWKLQFLQQALSINVLHIVTFIHTYSYIINISFHSKYCLAILPTQFLCFALLTVIWNQMTDNRVASFTNQTSIVTCSYVSLQQCVCKQLRSQIILTGDTTAVASYLNFFVAFTACQVFVRKS